MAGGNMKRLLTEVLPFLIGFVLLVVACAVRLWSLRRSLGQAVSGFARNVAPCLRRSTEADPLEPRVRAECERRRVERARIMVVGGSAVYAVHFGQQANLVRKGEAFEGATYVYVVGFVCALITLCPKLITQRTIDVGYVLIMTGMAISLLLEDRHKLTTQYQMGGTLVVGMCLSIIALRPWLNSACLGITFGGAATRLALLGQPSWADAGRNYLGVVSLVFFLEWSFRTGVRLELRAKETSNQLQAVQALLDSICDVIVELGVGLRLRKHSAKLADILLQGPMKSLEDAALQDFMPDERDRETFEQNLGACHERGASVFHATLRDSMGSTVAMELFAVAFKGPDGQQGHLLGMREYTDVQPMMGVMGPRTRHRHLPPAKEKEILQRGTPAAPARADLPVHSSAGSSEGDAGSEGSRSSASAKCPKKAERTIRNTTLVAKRASLAKTLECWKVEPTCCEWHAALCEVQQIARLQTHLPCSPPIAKKERGWQCQTCGIIGKYWRLGKNAERCVLCESFSEDMLVQESIGVPERASL